MKNAKLFLGYALVLFALHSCSNDNNDSTGTSSLKITAKSTYTGTKTAKLASTIALSSFKVNLKEIKFKYDDEMEDNHEGDDDNDGFYDDDDNFKLKGPFELNLLNGPIDFVATDIPQGVFEEVEFKLHRNTVSTSSMYNKSIEIKGTVDGVPFIFWHNLEEEFEVDYNDALNNITVGQNSVSIDFNFNLDAALSAIDLSAAQDGNGDGTIEISPDDPDGNHGLADLFKEKIKEFTELEDHDDED